MRITSHAYNQQLPPKEARDLFAALQASAPHSLPSADIEQKTVEQDGLAVSLTIVRPINLTERGPALLFSHGGGFVLGDFLTHERLVRDLVSDSEITAIFINYTRSPEARYPTAINEAYAATKWVAANGDEINVDGKRLALVGNSAGANIAAVTALKCKLEGGPALKGQLLFCPMTDANFETSSYNEYAEERPGAFLPRATAAALAHRELKRRVSLFPGGTGSTRQFARRYFVACLRIDQRSTRYLGQASAKIT